MAHAAARRRRQSRYERDDGLGVRALPTVSTRYTSESALRRSCHSTHRIVLHEVLGGVLLGHAADLADQNDTLGVGVTKKHLQAVDEISAVEGVTADTNTKGLPEADLRRLVDRLVGERTRSGHHSYFTLLVDVPRHDAYLALLRGNDARTVGADQPRLVLPEQPVLDAYHVMLRDALRNADYQRHLCVDRLQDGGGRGRWRHVYHGRIRSGRITGLQTTRA